MEKDEPILLSDLNLRCKENRGTTTDLVQRNVKREGSGHGPENAAFFVVMHEPAQGFRCMIDDDSDSINSSEQGVLTRLSHLSRAPLPVASTGVNLDGLRALVVDDSQINQRVAKHHLSTFGIRADVANGGQEVLDLCEMWVYDLLMIDFRLKLNDGVQTAQQLRALPGYARVPMVACIAQGNETWASRCQCLGIRGCLIKTFQIKAIGECLEKTLHLSEPARAC